jgi:hypothetical protein
MEPLTLEEAIAALKLAETALTSSKPILSHYQDANERHGKALVAVTNALLKHNDYETEKVLG